MSNHEYRSDPELESFAEVMNILSQGPSEISPEPVPDDLWSRISNEVQADSPRQVQRPPADTAAMNPAANISLDKYHDDRLEVSSKSLPISELSTRRSLKRNYPILGIAAAIVLLVMVPLALVWQLNRTVPVESVAQLDELEGFAGGNGTAILRGTSLEVEVGVLPVSDDAFYEVWAIDFEGDEIKDLTSLGRIEGSLELEWPEGINPQDYSVIDISVEPNDNNPDHSGESILRGGLVER